MAKLGIVVAACVGLWSAATVARNIVENDVIAFSVCLRCDAIISREVKVDPDDRIKVDKAFKEALGPQTIRAATTGRIVITASDRKIEGVQLFDRGTLLATARRQADGTYQVRAEDAPAPRQSDTPRPSAADEPSRWEVTTRTDKFDGTTSVVVTTRAEDDDGSLSVRCLADKTDVIVGWPQYLGSGNGQTIEWRLDDRPASSEFWPLDKSGRALFAPQPIALLKQMFAAREFAIRATPYATVQHSLLVRLAGLEDAIAPVRQACGW